MINATISRGGRHDVRAIASVLDLSLEEPVADLGDELEGLLGHLKQHGSKSGLADTGDMPPTLILC